MYLTQYTLFINNETYNFEQIDKNIKTYKILFMTSCRMLRNQFFSHI